MFLKKTKIYLLPKYALLLLLWVKPVFLADPPKKNVIMNIGNGTSCEISLLGAIVLSWKVENKEQLFLSKNAKFDGEHPVRGGIAFIFPAYGKWDSGPENGFARTSMWIEDHPPKKMPDGNIKSRLLLADNNDTLKMFEMRFTIVYEITLKPLQLHFSVKMLNPDKKKPLLFKLLMQNYFLAKDVKTYHVSGLTDLQYIDLADNSNILFKARDPNSQIRRSVLLEACISHLR